MKLSIVTINYNNAEGLKRTLASVASQTYRDMEHIIVDGGSTDGSVDVIQEYVAAEYAQERDTNSQESQVDIPDWIDESLQLEESGRKSPFFNRSIIWKSEKDNGIYHAMNKGLRRASGAYVQILNSGDILATTDVVERMVREIERQEYPAILYGNLIKQWPSGKHMKDTGGYSLYTPESFLYFYRGSLNHSSAYVRRDMYEKYGLYDENLKIVSDWKWFVKTIALGGEKAVYANIDVTIFDMNGISESQGKNTELIKKERREYLESILPATLLNDYDKFSFPILQYQRLKKYHLWGLVWFMERILFKLEKWHILK